MSINPAILKLNNVCKSFKGFQILHKVSLTVNQGEVIGIVGSNGSGKTTLLRIIMGLMYPDQGMVSVGGHEVVPGLLGNLPDRVGALIENPMFLPQFSGFQNLWLLASIRGELQKSDIEDIMRKVGLDPSNKRNVSKYSLGMRQRLGIAQAIMESPNLVLFDEPTNALDTEGVKRFNGIVREMVDEGTSFIVVSHRHEDITSLCDKVYKIDNGNLIPLEVDSNEEEYVN